MKYVARLSPLIVFVFLFLFLFLFLTVRLSEHRVTQGAKEAPQAAQLPAGVPSDWCSQVQEKIRREEMQATRQEADSEGQPFESPRWHLVNRGGRLRAYGDKDGVEFRSREDASWRVHMALNRAPTEEVKGEGERIIWERGTTQEWLENRAEGLEHGFTVREGPAAPFDLVLAVTTEGVHVSAAGEKRIIFSNDSRDVMEYRDLKVVDATGKELASRMEWTDGRLALCVLETGEYPIMVDPLATSPVWTAEGDQAGAQFGISVSTAGDVDGDGFDDIIVGARYYDNGQTNEGAAFVYYGSAAGISSRERWQSEGNQADADFGVSVGTAGDVDGDGYSDVIIGAALYNGGAENSGQAYVYYGSGTGISTTRLPWIAEGRHQAHGVFGYAVSTAGDVNNDGVSDIIVAAHGENSGAGRVYAYYGVRGQDLSTQASWTADGPYGGANFGFDISTAGDVNGDGFSDVIVGSHGENGEDDEGMVYVYHGSPTGLLGSPNWTAESNQVGAWLGYAVSTAGDVNGDGFDDVIAGALWFDNGQSLDEGRVFVYYGSATGLRQGAPADWTVACNQANAWFGHDVSTAGDVNGDGYADVIVSAPLYDNSLVDEGSAFLYYGSASGLLSAPSWTGIGGVMNANYGGSVASAGDVNGDGFGDVIVGALRYSNDLVDEGRAFVYLGAPGRVLIACDQRDAYFGHSVSTAGDVNGDGYSDVIVGAPAFDNGQVNEGKIFVYYGSSTGLSTTADWSAESDQANAWFGQSVSTAGDVNGDGFSEIIVGASFFSNGEQGEGAAFVYYGSATGLRLEGKWSYEGNQAYARFGTSVSAAEDVNNDGFDDVIVGAPGARNGGYSEAGRAYAFYGSAQGLPTGYANWSVTVSQKSASFGCSVAAAGDVNGDGYSDVIVGAPLFDDGGIDKGKVFVYHGSSIGLGPANWSVSGDRAYARFGQSVSTAGSVNGDRYSDIIVGAPGFKNGQSKEGAAFVFHGSSTGLRQNANANWSSEGNQAEARFGFSVSTAGDINNDGYSDIIVGAPYFDHYYLDEGRAVAYYGSASGLSAIAWIAEGGQYNAWFGLSVSTAGDVDGDGRSDVIVGAPTFSNGDDPYGREGRAALYYGKR